MSDYIQETFLYEFVLGTNTWRFTSNAVDVVDVESAVWTACPISDDGVKQTGEAVTDALNVTAPQKIAPAQLFKLSTPGNVMALTIYRADVVPLTDDQIDAGLSQRQVILARAVYVGEIAQASFPSPEKVVFQCEAIGATMRRQGLRLGWMRQCPHTIYDPVTCKVNKAAHAVVATVAAISGITVVLSGISTPANGLYNAGLMEFNHPVKGVESLTIESQSLLVFFMFGSVDGLYVGQSVTIYRGCNNTPASCQSFGNYPNYGGVPNLPGKSPFDGVNSPVF